MVGIRRAAWAAGAIVVLLGVALPAAARNLYVNHETGSDTASGSRERPLATIRRAIELAQPGDTVYLVPTAAPYRQTLELLNARGEPGKPITIDGQGATLTGADPLDPSHWREVEPGLWRCDDLYQRTDHGRYTRDSDIDAVAMRYFMVFDGVPQRMGRVSKGPSQPFKAPADLDEGEWTFQRDGLVFYIRTAPGKRLEDYRIELPLRSNGVAIYGERCEHLVVRNLTLKHVYNDGVNLHGTTRDIRLQNLAAIECGDDGISAHDDCEVIVDGFASIGNATGLCHTNDSRTTNSRLYIRGSLGYDVYVLNNSRHTIRDSLILASAPRPLFVGGNADERCTLTLENTAIVRDGPAGDYIRLYPDAEVHAVNCTFIGFPIIANARAVRLERCAVGGEPAPYLQVLAPTRWEARDNLYGLARMRFDQTTFTPEDAAAYAQAHEPEGRSRWGRVKLVEGQLLLDGEPAPPEIGAAHAELPAAPVMR